jgi:phosphate transport system permease protein
VTTRDTALVPEPTVDVPRRLNVHLGGGDRLFQGAARGIGLFVLVLTGSIGLFLGYQAIPTLQRYGFSFFTEAQWSPETDVVGVAAVVVGTAQIALIALIVAFPLALLTALFITEYCPPRLRAYAVGAIDLMAAIPSIIYGLWGLFLLEPHAINLSRWLSQHASWLPLFRVDTNPNAAAWEQAKYTGSAFVAGLCVAMMVVPSACAVMRGVFAQAPIGEREAAYALGGTRAGVIRTVVLPFGRGGIIGGTMLGLGRALGETIAVLLIIAPKFDLKLSVLSTGTETVSALIAGRFGESTSSQLTALLAAGFVLFAMTLLINTVAAVFVSRSRSGVGTDA